MKKIVFALGLIALVGNAQQINVSSTSSINIGNGASVNAFGLDILPNANYSISDNTISLTDVQVEVSGAKQSILRVYEFANTLTNYSGSLVLNYEDAEVLGGTEADLNFEIENITWTEYPSTVDAALNTITLDAALSNASMNRVTASAADVPLPIEDFELGELSIYPNPTTSELRIKSALNLQTQLFNSLGQKIEESNSKLIDMSQLSEGMYLLKLTDKDSNKSNTYQIIKK